MRHVTQITMKNKIVFLTAASVIVLSSLGFAGVTLAAQDSQEVTENSGIHRRANMQKPDAVGTVTAVNGSTIAISGRQGFGSTSTPITYTVDLASAKITKDNVIGTIASIAVGDNVAVQGTVNGSIITATTIRDGKNMRFGGYDKNDRPKTNDQKSVISAIVGNGQPVIAGTISVINGSTLTITNKSNVTYTVDALAAKITQGQNAVLIGSLSVGDSVVIQGTINGTSVVASTIIDQAKPATEVVASSQSHMGIFGGIGQFFMHMFGF